MFLCVCMYAFFVVVCVRVRVVVLFGCSVCHGLFACLFLFVFFGVCMHVVVVVVCLRVLVVVCLCVVCLSIVVCLLIWCMF